MKNKHTVDPTLTQTKSLPDEEPLMNSLRAHSWSEFSIEDSRYSR